MPKIFQMIGSLVSSLLSLYKLILQIYNVNNASKTVYVCNNLGNPIILEKVSS